MFELLILVAFAALLLNIIEASLRRPRCAANDYGRVALGGASLLAGCLATAGLLVDPALPTAAADEPQTPAATAPAAAAPAATAADGGTVVRAEAEPAAEAGEGAVAGQADPDGLSEPVTRPLEADVPRVLIPYSSRPEWVGTPLNLSSNPNTMSIVAGPYVHAHECRRALDDEKLRAVAEYINEYLGNPRASLLIRYDLDYINQHLLRRENVHEEVVTVSFGPMYQIHALLEFDENFQADLNEHWRQVKATSRLAQTGLGAAGVLGLLVLVFGYFKLDSRTRGYCTCRLQLLAAAALAGLVLAGVFASRLITWI